MNRPGIVRFTGSAVGVGVAPVEITLTGPAGLADPPVRGEILRVGYTVTGPATVFDLNVREGSGGTIRYQLDTETAVDSEKQPLPVSYQRDLVDDLVFEVDCDDGTDSTNFTFTVDIMVR